MPLSLASMLALTQGPTPTPRVGPGDALSGIGDDLRASRQLDQSRAYQQGLLENERKRQAQSQAQYTATAIARKKEVDAKAAAAKEKADLAESIRQQGLRHDAAKDEDITAPDTPEGRIKRANAMTAWGQHGISFPEIMSTQELQQPGPTALAHESGYATMMGGLNAPGVMTEVSEGPVHDTLMQELNTPGMEEMPSLEQVLAGQPDMTFDIDEVDPIAGTDYTFDIDEVDPLPDMTFTIEEVDPLPAPGPGLDVAPSFQITQGGKAYGPPLQLRAEQKSVMEALGKELRKGKDIDPFVIAGYLEELHKTPEGMKAAADIQKYWKALLPKRKGGVGADAHTTLAYAVGEVLLEGPGRISRATPEQVREIVEERELLRLNDTTLNQMS